MTIHNRADAAQVIVSLYKSVKSHKGGATALPFEDFVKRAARRTIGEKIDAPVVYLASFKPAGPGEEPHVKDGATAITGFVLDVEANKVTGEVPPSFAEAVVLLKASFFNAWIAYTTHNHLENLPRYRILGPYKTPIELPDDPDERDIFFEAERKLRRRVAAAIGVPFRAANRS